MHRIVIFGIREYFFCGHAFWYDIAISKLSELLSLECFRLYIFDAHCVMMR